MFSPRPSNAVAGPSNSPPSPPSCASSASLPPWSLRDILDSFGREGNGDRELLLSILSAKRAEDERLAVSLALQAQMFALAAAEHHALLQLAPIPFSGPTPSSRPSPRASSSHSARHHPYASSSTSDAPEAAPRSPPALRSAKLALAAERIRQRRASPSSQPTEASSFPSPTSPLSPAPATLVLAGSHPISPQPPSPSTSAPALASTQMAGLLAFTSPSLVKESFVRSGSGSDEE